MGLFNIDKIRQHLPEGDERAMDLLWQIDQIYETTNASNTCGKEEIIDQYRVDKEVLLFFIEISVHNPHLLEEMLASEPSLPQLIDWATCIMSDTVDPTSIATEEEYNY